ncbi:MAG: metal-dependent hydrolase [Clostridia bacterium]|nr:metal-dependent hydrolase [Clostridia bacterium]
MDPVTHAVLGLSLSKFSGNGIDLSNPVVAGIVIGSVFPDIDIVLQKWGDYVYLKNHRGITHSVLGTLIASVVIAFALGGIYGSVNVFGIFICTFAGCMSHTLIDILNSYGAKLMWPFSNKKFSLSLLIIFDPVMFVLLLLYVFSNGSWQNTSILIMSIYMLLRILMRLAVRLELISKFGEECGKISILPSMTGLFRWHFIVETEEYNLIGEKNLLNKRITLIHRLKKIQDVKLDRILLSPIGKFFLEFTPLYHIACEKAGDVRRYIFIDMRYCIKSRFLHHGILEVDERDRFVKSSFNPYSMNRANSMPLQ